MAVDQRRKKRDIPEGLWLKCPGCEQMVYRKAVEERLRTCPECNHHFSVSAKERIRMLSDADSFEEYLPNLASPDPLKFVDRMTYVERLERERQRTNLYDAAVVGRAYVRGRPAILAALDPDFMRGSMGAVVGEKITVAIEKATSEVVPLVIVSASGGARMQESVISLAQMTKTSAALGRFHAADGLFISVVTNPTTGGVAASFAMLGDFIIAEPRALIGFAGPRVILQTMKRELPDGFQTSEFLLEHGFIDMIVDRAALRSEIAALIDYCGK